MFNSFFSIISISFDVIQYAIPIGILVSGISIIAKNEASYVSSFYKKLNKIMMLITIGFTMVLILNDFHAESLIFLSLFLILISYTLFEKKIQSVITFQLLSIILLDAALISIFSSFYVSILISSLIVPAYLITKKLYIT